MRLGIFGGTFNPVHYGHLRAAEDVLSRMPLDRIVFVPTGTPPLKSADLADARDRYAMTALAIAGNPSFSVSDIELTADGKSFTIHTIARLKRKHPHDHLFFMLGIDAFLDLPNWYRPDELMKMVDLIIMTRPGYDPDELVNSPFILFPPIEPGRCWQLTGGKTATSVKVSPQDISSTAIRHLIRTGQSIDHLVPNSVATHIHEKHLYRP